MGPNIRSHLGSGRQLPSIQVGPNSGNRVGLNRGNSAPAEGLKDREFEAAVRQHKEMVVSLKAQGLLDAFIEFNAPVLPHIIMLPDASSTTLPADPSPQRTRSLNRGRYKRSSLQNLASIRRPCR